METTMAYPLFLFSPELALSPGLGPCLSGTRRSSPPGFPLLKPVFSRACPLPCLDALICDGTSLCVCVCVGPLLMMSRSDDHRADESEAAARPSEGAVLPAALHAGAGAHRRPAAPGVVGTFPQTQFHQFHQFSWYLKEQFTQAQKMFICQ